MADDAPTSEEMKRLEEKIATLEKQKELLEKEKDVIEASRLLENAKAGPSATSRETAKLTEDLALLAEKKKAIDALTPQLPQGLAGSITLDDSQLLEAQIVTYQMLSTIAGEIAKEVGKAGTAGTIVLVTQDDLNALAAVQMFETERELLRLELERHAPEMVDLSLTASLLAIGPLVKTAADVMALFRTDTEFKAKSIVVADEAFVASVAGHLEGVRYYPAVFPSNALNLQALIDAMKPLGQEFRAALARHQKQTAGEPADEVAVRARDELVRNWAQLNTKVQAFSDALRTRDSATGTTPLHILSRGLWLLKELEGDHVRLVLLKVLHAGGSYVIRKTFWRGASLAQSGGVIVEFLIFDGKGKVLGGGTRQSMRAFADLNTQPVR